MVGMFTFLFNKQPISKVIVPFYILSNSVLQRVPVALYPIQHVGVVTPINNLSFIRLAWIEVYQFYWSFHETIFCFHWFSHCFGFLLHWFLCWFLLFFLLLFKYSSVSWFLRWNLKSLTWNFFSFLLQVCKAINFHYIMLQLKPPNFNVFTFIQLKIIFNIPFDFFLWTLGCLEVYSLVS